MGRRGLGLTRVINAELKVVRIKHPGLPMVSLRVSNAVLMSFQMVYLQLFAL